MILIDYKSRKPIYEQIIENMKQLVVSGALKRDEQIPSVRQLAQELAINPNTIQKAYAELERQGVIYSLKGRGSFVGSSLQELR
ncbi:MAG: GntR family transcriptional regulator, partial [Peptococcaceae bacterium]|nr:GntR family transcriptional regulator [Peptococcaceae bacterium]